MQEAHLELNRAIWDKFGPSIRRTALPRWGPLAPPEDELKLLGNLRGQRVLELGCGDGGSLVWLAEAGAAELWGLDVSASQLISARQQLDARQLSARVIQSSFEDAVGLPEQYFDLAVSVFALGWAIGLDAVMARIANCLRPGGRLVFSWEHPFFSLLAEREGQVIVGESYLGHGRPQHRSFHGVEVVLVARSLGDWIAALRGSGLILEGLIEPDLDERQLAEHHRESGYVYSSAKASRVPTTFIMAAHKPGAS
ncbi:MAG TPA: class I SAM-dependent methyltransferase [Dongiaceae bacterium]|nr:class I SAM-dependent methyltransferase [Dongiaceae bacterium]